MKAQILVFASQKGGSGKTTLSGHVAVQAHLDAAGPVAMIDTDPQRSLAQWHEARRDASMLLKAGEVGDIEAEIAELERLGARTIIIDTPPAATAAISRVVRHADLVCIPARPSPHDLRAVGATIEIVEAERKPMVFVLNGATVRARNNSEAIMALSQHGTVASVVIHNRVDFASSMTEGGTVMETDPKSRSADEVRALWSYLTHRLGKLAELREPVSERAVAAQEQPQVIPFFQFQRPDRAHAAKSFFGRAGSLAERPCVEPMQPRIGNLPAAPHVAIMAQHAR